MLARAKLNLKSGDRLEVLVSMLRHSGESYPRPDRIVRSREEIEVVLFRQTSIYLPLITFLSSFSDEPLI